MKLVRFRAAFLCVLIYVCLSVQLYAQKCTFTIARLKYNGGGDWYANPSSLPNLTNAIKTRTSIQICDSIATIELNNERLYTFPFIYITGHGDIRLSPEERIRLRRYLIGGGFLWADDNYGLDKSFREEMKLLFPENPLIEISASHPIFSSFYKLKGLPKIHEHDGEPSRAYGIFFNSRMIVFYSYSSDIGDGMEDLHIHNDGEVLHEAAIKMGINVIQWFFNP